MKLHNSLEFILYKSYTEIKSDSARSYLGLLWWIIEPALYLFSYYVVFVLVLNRKSPDFIPSFLCGAVVWKWFSSGLNGGSHAISTHRGLLQQVYVPKYVFPIIAVLGSTIRFLPVFAIFSIFLLLYGVPVQTTWLMVPIVMLIQLCLVMALAMLVGTFTPFMPDLKVVIDNGMMVLFFVSGIFFNINEVQEPLKGYLLLNPMAGLIDEYRNVMIRGIWPNTGRLTLILLVSVALGALALALLKKMDSRYGKVRF